MKLRAATTGDLDDAARLLVREGWSFTTDELARLMRLGGGSVAETEGRVVGFLTYVDLAPVRWIGNVVVDERARGQGVGARLVARTLEAPGRVAGAGLYSVEKAVTLYERAGFRTAGEAWAHRAEDARPLMAQAKDVTPMEDSHLPDVFRLDRARTGMDRRALLGELYAAFPDHACVLREAGGGLAGFGFAKPYDDVTELGPLVAESPAAARTILDALLDVTDGPHEATALGANPLALEALRKRGFEPTFRTVPMFRDVAPVWTTSALFVAAGLEKS